MESFRCINFIFFEEVKDRSNHIYFYLEAIMSHCLRPYRNCPILIVISPLILFNQILGMTDMDYLVTLSMNNQQFPIEFCQLFLVIEVLLNYAAGASHMILGHFFNCVKWGHQDKQRDWPMSGQIRCSSGTDGATHHQDIISASSLLFLQVVIEVKRILLDLIGDQDGAQGVILTV